MPLLPVPPLSALVLAPALGALVITLLPEGRAKLRRGLALFAGLVTLSIATTVAVGHLPEGAGRLTLVERYGWIPTFGASYELGLDSLSAMLVGWVSLLAMVALLADRPEQTDRATTALILVWESGLLGLFLARDVFLLLGFLGATTASFALLLGHVSAHSMRRFFSLQITGLALLFGLAAFLSHLVYVQTGFTSGELARWEDLVIFPELEGRCFLVGAAAIAILAPQLPALLWLGDGFTSLSASGRVLVTGSYSLVGGYLLFRFVLRLVPRGAEAGAFPLLALALIGLLFVALSSRPSDGDGPSWERILVAYQSLVLVGLLSLDEDSIAAALVLLVHQAAALTAITLSTGETEAAKPAGRVDRVLFLLSCASLVAIPSAAGVLSSQWVRSPWIAVLVAVAFLLLAWRIVRWARSSSHGDRLPALRRRGVLIPVLVCCLWLAVSTNAWELRFGKLAGEVLSRLVEPTESSEAGP